MTKLQINDAYKIINAFVVSRQYGNRKIIFRFLNFMLHSSSNSKDFLKLLCRLDKERTAENSFYSIYIKSFPSWLKGKKSNEFPQRTVWNYKTRWGKVGKGECYLSMTGISRLSLGVIILEQWNAIKYFLSRFFHQG